MNSHPDLWRALGWYFGSVGFVVNAYLVCRLFERALDRFLGEGGFK